MEVGTVESVSSAFRNHVDSGEERVGPIQRDPGPRMISTRSMSSTSKGNCELNAARGSARRTVLTKVEYFRVRAERTHGGTRCPLASPLDLACVFPARVFENSRQLEVGRRSAASTTVLLHNRLTEINILSNGIC